MKNKTLTKQLKINNFPFEIKDNNENQIYYEYSNGYWCKKEFNQNNEEIYFEDSIGIIEDNRKEKVVEITFNDIAKLLNVPVEKLKLKK